MVAENKKCFLKSYSDKVCFHRNTETKGKYPITKIITIWENYQESTVPRAKGFTEQGQKHGRKKKKNQGLDHVD